MYLSHHEILMIMKHTPMNNLHMQSQIHIYATSDILTPITNVNISATYRQAKHYISPYMFLPHASVPSNLESIFMNKAYNTNLFL